MVDHVFDAAIKSAMSRLNNGFFDVFRSEASPEIRGIKYIINGFGEASYNTAEGSIVRFYNDNRSVTEDFGEMKEFLKQCHVLEQEYELSKLKK